MISSFLSNTSFSSGLNGFLTEGNFLEVFGVGITDGRTEPGLLYMLGIGFKSHLRVVHNPFFKYFSSKCFAQIPEFFVGVQYLRLTK